MATVQIEAAENVGRALEAMRFVEIDDYAASVIGRSELRHVGELILAIAEDADEVSPGALRELSERLTGIADAFQEVQ